MLLFGVLTPDSCRDNAAGVAGGVCKGVCEGREGLGSLALRRDGLGRINILGVKTLQMKTSAEEGYCHCKILKNGHRRL
eukprot:443229-Pyramimonas_sp.AAC.1